MISLTRFWLLCGLCVGFLVACQGQAPADLAPTATVVIAPPTAEVAATEAPVATAVVISSTPAAEAAPSATAVDWTTVAVVEDNLYLLGNPNAPIRLIDYSDFL